MSTLSAKDRVSLCKFTFSDGRRCRTPRTGKNPHFCFDHAQKEARANAEESLSKDLAYFFSGDYLSACDLSAALGSLIPAVVRGDVKPKTARTVAYLAQTLMQSIHLSKHEYINAFGTDGWRKSIRNSVNANRDYRFPPAPKLEPGPVQPESPQPQPQPAPTPPPVTIACPACHPERSEGSHPIPATQPAPAPQPSLSPHTPLPSTGAEFVHHLVASRNLSRPGRETGSASPSSPLSSNDSAPARTSTTQSAPSSPTPPPAPDNSQRAPAPLAAQSTSPRQSQPTRNSQRNSLSTPAPPAPRPSPPGFGGPANWDVLIPPKPRRRFSHLWQSHR